MNKETNPAVLLGKLSWKSRKGNKTKEEISKMMSTVRKSKKLTSVR